MSDISDGMAKKTFELFAHGPEHHVIADLAARLAKAERALEEAEEVIEPFRALAAEVFREGMNSWRKDDAGLWGFDSVTLTYGHLRAARKWMESRHDA